MFHHCPATGKSEHNCAICQGWWDPSVEWDVEREPTMMQLVQPDSFWEDIADLYCEVYHLWRLPGKICCDEEMEACICQEIMDSVKNSSGVSSLLHCWGKNWDRTQLTSPRLKPKGEFNTRNCATYDRFIGNKWDSCKEALAMARDAHWWALAAAALSEDKIERMSHSLSCSCLCSRSHRQSGSCQQRRSWNADHETKAPGQCHTMGTLVKAEPSHPVLPNQDGR